MPRKTSQAAKKDTDAKTDAPAPRRSGRAVTKPETTSAKSASRSRRSSTAAQTAASVADSRTPKGRTSVGSRRESTSPSDNRTRTGRDGAESPVSRIKSARRSTSRINYKESDGEEEAPTPKYDENFDSGDNLEESESDEKSKPQARGRSARTPAKGRASKQQKTTPRSRRGRPAKKNDEEEETVEISDDSAEVEEVPVKKGRAAKEKEPAKSRRQRSEVTEVKAKPATESRPSRRSGRASLSKEETPAKKRPSRSVQAKKYTEEEDDDIEEIIDSKLDEDDADLEKKETDTSRKRKRGSSPEEASKRLKESEENPEDETDKKVDEKGENDDEELESKKTEEKVTEEPMEVDETDPVPVPKEMNKEVKEGDNDEPKMEEEEKCEEKPSEEKDEAPLPPKEIEESSKQSTESLKDSKESLQTTNWVTDKVENPASSGLEDSKDAKDPLKDTIIEQKQPIGDVKPAESKDESLSQISDSPLAIEEVKLEDSKSSQPSVIAETKPEKEQSVELSTNSPVKNDTNVHKNDTSVTEEKKLSEPPISTPVSAPITSPQTKEHSSESSLSDAQKNDTVVNTTHETHGTANANFEHTEKSTPKANGAHNDVQHTNSTSSNEQYYLPGRKYISNSKLSDNIQQAVKNKTFGFVSYNLGTPNSDAYLQKEKLLNELNKLDAHVICLQQVAKPFYNAVLEPSLDALGFKSVFSQPEDSLKGMATFYKSSLFRLSGKSDISLKNLIEKELETLDLADRSAVRSHIRKCGSVLFTHFTTVIGTQTITVANVQIPPTDLSIHALQMSCLAREVVRINGGSNKPLLLGGEFNIAENDASYQLLRDGYLNNDMIEELQRRKDVVLPEKENTSLVDLLWKAFQHPSSNLCSCYTSVLDHEFFIPELKRASSDLLWYSSGSLHTVGVLDVVSDKPGDHHFSLKADIAFSV